LLATLCGATSCCDMALFARTKEELLRSVLDLKFGLPSHDTFSRVFRLLDPKGFEEAFQRFMKAFSASLKLKRAKGVIAIAGKADYVLAVKDNQPKLLAAAKAAIATARRNKTMRSAPRQEISHGRKENRIAVVVSAKTVAQELAFPGLKAFAMIRSRRGTDK